MQLAKIVSLLTLTLLLSPALSAELRDLSATVFSARVELPSPTTCKRVKSVIYGNLSVGYFESTDFVQNKTLHLTFFPPSYLVPIEFYAKGGQCFEHLKNLQLKKPHSSFLESLETSVAKGVRGHYFLMLASLVNTNPHDLEPLPGDSPPRPEPHKPVVYYILNRIGEVVWAHSPKWRIWDKDLTPKSKIGTFKPFGSDFFITQSDGSLVQYFQIVSNRGVEKNSAYLQLTHIDELPHHDFTLNEKNKLITFGNAVHYLPFQSFAGKNFWSFFGADVINEFDLERGEFRTIGNLFDLFDPIREVSSGISLDFIHANSIASVEGGYLLSLKNLNKIVLLTADTKSVKWTLGKSATDTFRTSDPRTFFYNQHSASLLSKNNILLFDNGEEKSRLLHLSLNSKSGKADFVREYLPMPALKIAARGNAGVLPNENIYGYFPGVTPKEASYFIEFEQQTGREVSRTNVFGKNWRGINQVFPIAAVGNARFIGSSFASQELALK